MFYHASKLRGLRQLRPSTRSVRKVGDPPRVYVSHRQVVAIGFMINPTDDWSVHGSYDGGSTFCLIIGDEARFWEEEQMGGSLYSVRRDEQFHSDPEVGLGEHEFYSSEPVEVWFEQQWNSMFEAMKFYGLKIYFMPPASFPHFRQLDEQVSLIRRARSRKNGTFDVVL